MRILHTPTMVPHYGTDQMLNKDKQGIFLKLVQRECPTKAFILMVGLVYHKRLHKGNIRGTRFPFQLSICRTHRQTHSLSGGKLQTTKVGGKQTVPAVSKFGALYNFGISIGNQEFNGFCPTNGDRFHWKCWNPSQVHDRENDILKLHFLWPQNWVSPLFWTNPFDQNTGVNWCLLSSRNLTKLGLIKATMIWMFLLIIKRGSGKYKFGKRTPANRYKWGSRFFWQ